MAARLAALLLVSHLSLGCQWVTQAMSRRSIESRALSNRARLARENGDYRQATQLLAQAIETDPANMELRRRLARAHLAGGDPAAAVRELKYVVSAHPDDAGVLTELAEAYRAGGKQRQALVTVESALEHDSTHLPALSLHARLLENSGRLAEAENDYHQILDLDRHNTEARLRLGLVRLKSNQPDQAAPLLRAVCQCAQTSPGQRAEARWALGIAYGEVGRWEEASDNLAAALPHLKHPGAEEWYRLAYAQQQSGDLAGAKLNLSRTLQIDPKHAGAVAMARNSGELLPDESKSADGIRYAAAELPPAANRRTPRLR